MTLCSWCVQGKNPEMIFTNWRWDSPVCERCGTKMSEPFSHPHVPELREEPLVHGGDGLGEGGPPAGDDGGVGMVKDLDEPGGPGASLGVEIQGEPEAILDRPGVEGGEHLGGAGVEQSRDGHGASGEVKTQEQYCTGAAPEGRGLTREMLEAVLEGVLQDIDREVELEKKSLPHLDRLTDSVMNMKIQWKKDAVRAYARRLLQFELL